MIRLQSKTMPELSKAWFLSVRIKYSFLYTLAFLFNHCIIKSSFYFFWFFALTVGNDGMWKNIPSGKSNCLQQ